MQRYGLSSFVQRCAAVIYCAIHRDEIFFRLIIPLLISENAGNIQSCVCVC